MQKQLGRFNHQQRRNQILKAKTDHSAVRSQEDFFKDVKKEVFENLDNTVANGFIPEKSNQEIADDMLNCTTGYFHKAGSKVLCRYIQEWKDINLT